MPPTLTRSLLAIALLSATAAAQSLSADESETVVTFPGDHLLIDLPVHADAAISASVSVQVLFPDDRIVADATTPCALNTGLTHCRVTLPPMHYSPANYNSSWLPQLRIRYTVTAASTITGTLSLNHIAPTLYEFHVVGPHEIHPGGIYTASIRTVHPLTGAPRPHVALTAEIDAKIEGLDDDRTLDKQHLVTDARGFATVRFTAPTDPRLRSINLSVEGKLVNVTQSTGINFNVPNHAGLELTTDKPLYQPGQTVHTRLLLLDHDAHASAKKTITFDVHDPDSTLVFRVKAVTSRFGIATADWAIPAGLRLGTYRISAETENGPSGGAQIRISRYDLPTFTVDPKPDRPFYLPGDNAIVEVHANYLFGKPVLHGHVRVVREDDRTWNYREQKFDTKEGKSVEGELDGQGRFLAHIDISEDEKQYLDPDGSKDPSNDFTDLHLAAYVTDPSTNSTEQRRFDVRVTAQALHLYVIGEHTQTIGLPQRLYLAVTAADGTPTECDLSLALLPHDSPKETAAQAAARALPLQHLHTNSLGLAPIDLPIYEALQKLRPPLAPNSPPSQSSDEDPELLITARDAQGRTGSLSQTLNEPELDLRITAAKPLYRSGDAIQLTVESATLTETKLPITVQLIRSTQHGDVVLDTREVTLDHGAAKLTIPTDERYAGYIHALATVLPSLSPTTAHHQNQYYFNASDVIVSASTALLFPRDNALHVDVQMNALTYHPGDQATAKLSVHGPPDIDGDLPGPIPAALGLVAVDQAVTERNRTDTEFGNADNSSFFFHWYSPFAGSDVGGFTLPQIARLDLAKPIPPGVQLAATILLQRVTLNPETGTSETGDSPQNTFANLLNARLKDTRESLAAYLRTEPDAPTTEPELAKLLANPPAPTHLDNVINKPAPIKPVDFLALRDPWDRPFTLIVTPTSYGQMQLQLRTSGPDKLPNTDDDFAVPLATWQWFARHQRILQQATINYHQRTGRYIRDLDVLRDEMQREAVDFASWRDPWNQPFAYTFGINTINYTITAHNPGDSSQPPNGNDSFQNGTVYIDYFSEQRAHLTNILNDYAAAHPFPTTEAELETALATANLSLDTLQDPWGHPLYATFHTRSFFTDTVRTEAHAIPGEPAHTRTIITPITATSDSVIFRSNGPDGKQGTEDDFDFAQFTHIRAQQSAKDASPQSPSNNIVRSGATGSLEGTVTDTSGAVIPGASITARDLANNTITQEKTDEQGRYILNPLPTGRYSLTIAFPGFVVLIYEQVDILANNTTQLDATLQVGSATQTVEVSAEAATVSTMNASIASVMNGQSISDLPLANRSFAYLAGLLPGVGSAMGGRIAKEETSTPRLRDYFPETLLWRPEVITSEDGHATVRFPVADNITTWQLSVAASTLEGNVGAGAAQFATFQPFFAAFQPPRILTTGDTIALPIPLRNYLNHAITVRGELTPTPWFKLDGPTSTTTQIASATSESPVFRFTATAPIVDGKQLFTARATGTADAHVGDSIARAVTVHPNGLPTAVTVATVLSPGDNTLTLNIPADAIPNGSTAILRLYPNLAAHLRDALAAMVEYPSGCAEQIISTAWPSLLLQRYAANIPHPNKALQKETHTYLEEAYENLLGEQRSDGGFAYWSNDPVSDPALTAYAIQFLVQAQDYIDVDDSVITKAVAYLAKQQTHQQVTNAGLWIVTTRDRKPQLDNRSGNAMLTASIAAMIANAPNAAPLVANALKATQPFVEEFDEPYTLGNYALAALAIKDTTRSTPAINRLRTLALTENGGAYWKLETNTPFFGWGRAGRVESSAAALRALIASGADAHDDLVARGLLFLDHEQDRHGLWYSTQASARVLDVLAAIALTAKAPAKAGAPGMLRISINGGAPALTGLPAAADDAGPIYVPIRTNLTPGTHTLTLTVPATATAQVVANLYTPWPATPPISSTTKNEQLRLTMAFSTTTPAPNTTIETTAHIERLGFRGYGMMIAEIGLPPGADVDRASLQSAMDVSDWQLNRYEVLPDRILVYLWPTAGGFDLRFKFKLRYAIDALTAPSVVYDYYNPDARFDLAPTHFTAQ